MIHLYAYFNIAIQLTILSFLSQPLPLQIPAKIAIANWLRDSSHVSLHALPYSAMTLAVM